MQKRFFIGMLVAVLAISPFAASALSTADVQAQIQTLMAKIAELTAQINVLKGQADIPPAQVAPTATNSYRICTILNRNLAQGAQGTDVTGLQEFLAGQGYLNAQATGYFGSLTASALAKWQASQGIDSVGTLGPKSRDRLMQWCGGGGIPGQQFTATPTHGNAPLTVTFSTWLSAFRTNTVSYLLDYGDGASEKPNDCNAPADACTSPGQNTHTYTADGTYAATLIRVTNTCPPNAQCFAAPKQEVIGKVQITVGAMACTADYTPVCGAKPIVCITTPCNPVPTTYSNRCAMTNDNASYLYNGQCRSENPADDPQCKSWYDGCNSCSRANPGDPGMCTLKYCAVGTVEKAYCTARFDTTTNKAPVISGFSGPTTLSEDASGTWTVNAKDPEGGTLSYQVWWGDENVYASQYTTAAGVQDFTQSTTFTHIYSNPGTYTVSITVRDSAGQEARSTSTVKVSAAGGGVVCSDLYQPVCGRPSGCANTCAPGMMCTMNCQLHDPMTYSNRCYLDAAGATYLAAGQCSLSAAPYQYTQ